MRVDKATLNPTMHTLFSLLDAHALRCAALLGLLVSLTSSPVAAQFEWDEDAEAEAEAEAQAAWDEDTAEDGEDSTQESEGGDDPFAYEEPAPDTNVRVRFGVGLGVGSHGSEAPTSRSLQTVSSGAFLMGTTFASFEVAEPGSVGYGLSLAYRSSIGQKASTTAPPVDRADFTGRERVVSSPARKQEVLIDGVLRVPFGDSEDSASLPMLFGVGFMGFNTDQEIPVMEYSVFDAHFQPTVRIPVGPVELELGALGGVGFSIDSGLEDHGYASMGFLYGGQVGVDIMVADPFILFLNGRFRQTVFSADDGSGNFIDNFIAFTFGAAARF